MADGRVTIDTRLDDSGIKSDIKKVETTVSNTGKKISKATSIKPKVDSSKIQSVLNDTEKSARSKASSIASIYKQAGYDSSEAFKMAWSNVKSGSASIVKATNNTKEWKTAADNTKQSFSGMKGILKSIATTVVVAFSVKKLVDFGKEAVEIASNLQEVQNVVDTSFMEIDKNGNVITDMTKKMEDFAQTSIETYGISKLTAKKTGSTYMAMARGMGLAMDSASDMAISLTGLSADMASFYNVEQDVANTALKSIFTGETETLKQFGIVMTEANLQQFAYTQGINKKISAMTQSEKVQLRYNYVMNQTKLVQGDFAKTSDSWANQTRILSEKWKEFLGIMGNGLLQVLTPCVRVLNQLMNGVLNVANAIATSFGFDKVTASADSASNAVSGVSDATQDLANSTNDATDATNNNTDATKKNQKAQKSNLATYDDLKVIQKETSDSSDGSGDVGSGTAQGLSNLSDGLAKFDKEANSSGSIIDKLSGPLESLKQLALELATAFQTGFTLSLGSDWNERVSKIKGDLTSIKTSLNSIFTNVDVTTSASTFMTALATNLGAYYGMFLSVGTSIASNIIGGIATYLNSSKDYIAGQLSTIFNINADTLNSMTSLYASVSSIFKVLETDEAKNFSGNLIGIFSSAVLGITNVLSSIANSFVTLVVTPIVNNESKIKEALQGAFGVLNTALAPVKGTIESAFSTFSTVYEQKIQPAVTKIANGIGSIFGTILDVFNTNLMPVFEKLSSIFSTIWTSCLEPLVTNVIKFGGDIIDLVSNLYSNLLVPLVDFIVKVLGVVVAPVIDVLGTLFIGTFGAIATAIDAVIIVLDSVVKAINFFVSGDFIEVLTSIKDTIGNAFVKAASAIKNAFSGIKTWFSENVWDKIKDVFSNVKDWFKNKFSGAYSAITSAFGGVKTFFSGVFGNIKDVFGGIADWFKTTFTKAWTNVKNVFSKGGKVFSGIKDGILNGLKTVINALIDGINKVITVPFKGLNKALTKIKNTSILGLTPFDSLPTISVPKIPKLAQGAVIPANKEFLAILGDQKHGTNIETPLETMLEAFTKALDKRDNNNGDVIIQIDGREVFRAVKNQNDTYKKMTGRSQLT